MTRSESPLRRQRLKARAKRPPCPRCGLPTLPDLELETECARCGDLDQPGPKHPAKGRASSIPGLC